MSYYGSENTSMGLGMFMLIIAVLGASILGISIGWQSCTGTVRRGNAERQGLEYAQKMYPGKTATVLCQAQDTDGNGYISCTLKVGNRTEAIECSSYYTINTNNGCRPARAVLTQPVQSSDESE